MSRAFTAALAAAAAAAAPGWALAAEDAAPPPPATVSPLVVVAPTAVAGPGVDADKLPGASESLSAADLVRTGSAAVTDVLEQRTPGVSLSDAQGNGFARNLNYRGFTASPLQGTPQGLAVYLAGVRLNEAFGDTVNWDLVPEAAVSRIDLVTGDAAFGLNALGGALNLTMKTGRDLAGVTAGAEGGSFGHAFGSVEFGGADGARSGYLALDGGHEDGWRLRSASQVVRGYGDLGWRGGPAEAHLVMAASDTRLGVVGPTPRDLLAQDRRATYTFPQTTRDRSGLVALNGSYKASDLWTLQGGVYGRAFGQDHLDGNDGSFEGCGGASGDPLAGTLCLQDDAFPAAIRPPTAAFQVQTLSGVAIGCPPLVAGQTEPCNGVPYGTLDRTRTRTVTGGLSLQAVRDGPLLGHGNVFTAGASYDRSTVRFRASSTLALIFPDLSLRTEGGVAGEGQAIRTAGAIAFSPVDLHAAVEAAGLYAVDTLDLTPRLFLTLSGRFNSQRTRTADQTGVSPDLNGAHRFDRFDPAAGLAWKVTEAVTAYGGYAETNRAPTPLELSCSNPLKPCLLENALVSDPPLKQVVARTWQAGLRGRTSLRGGRLDWRVGAYRADNINDIIALASALQGRGSFANVPRTRRQGLEAEVSWKSARWSGYASATHTEATYQFTGDLASPNSPFADDAGHVHVRPGDRIGGIAPDRLKAGADVNLTPVLSVGADVLGVSAQRRVGDEAGRDAKLAAYWTAGLHASWSLGHGLELFGRVDNLFDRRYATFGAYFGADGVANVHPSPLPADPDPRTDTPAAPRSFQLGLRASW